MFDQLLENTILLFVAVDPIALVPIFASLTQGLNKDDIKKIYIQATIVSFFVLSLFYIFGTAILDLMGISMSSFKRMNPATPAAMKHRIVTTSLFFSESKFSPPNSDKKDGTPHLTRMNIAVIIPPKGSIYFDERLSITSKNVSPR